MNGRLPHVSDALYTGLLVVALGAAGVAAVVVVVRLMRGRS